MKRTLTLAGFAIIAYVYFYLSSVLVLFTYDPAEQAEYWLNETGIKVLMGTVVIVIPAHFMLVRKAFKNGDIDFALSAAYFVIPYMLGVTVQAIIL